VHGKNHNWIDLVLPGVKTSSLDLGTLFTDGTAAVGHVLDVVALVQLLVESLVLAAANATRTSLDTDEVHLAIVLRRVEGVVSLLLAEQLRSGCRRWAAEAQEGLGVTVLHLIGPIALVGGRIPGQTLGAVEHEATARGAVHKLSTVAGIAHAVVSELVGALIRWLSGLQAGLALGALHVDRVAAGVTRGLFVVQQTVGAELLLGHSVLALNVGIAGSGHGSSSIRLLACTGGGGSWKK